MVEKPTTIWAEASRAMALRLSPPEMRASRALGAAPSTALATCATKRTALPLSSLMLRPEWPPIRPAAGKCTCSLAEICMHSLHNMLPSEVAWHHEPNNRP